MKTPGIHRPSLYATAGALWLAAALSGCTDSGPTGTSAQALFELPRPGSPPPSGFYALPFPNDVRVDQATGLMDLSDYKRPNALLEDYVETIQAKTRGFSVTAASFVRFDAAIDTESLPNTPDAARAADAAVYLVNVEPTSPAYGERVPLRFRFEEYRGQTIGANWLSILPYPGFVLEEQTRYAAVVTRRVRATDGSPVAVPPEFAAVIAPEPSADPVVARAQALYQPLTTWLDQPGGDERADVVVASVFTTQDATSLMGQMRQVIWDDLPAPQARDLVRQDDMGANYYWYDGWYDGPCFQQGTPPYSFMADGGDIGVDPDTGRPVIQRMEALRFSYTVPLGPMPATGWPVVIYAHGTGGDYQSFVYEGLAELMAANGLAMISIDQIMHGPRVPPGGVPELLFFNFQNPLSARDNTLQGAADDFQLLRLALGFDYSDPDGGPQGMRFDPDRVYFFGHSQGGLTGPPFLAHEPLVSGAILSGAGGLLYMSLILKTEPVDIASLVASFIRDYPLDEFNPMLALIQMYMDRADPVVYGRLLITDPPPGVGAKNIFQSEGFTDRFTPTRSIEAFATSMGVDQVSPVIEPIEGLRLRGHEVAAPPVTDNQGVTAVLLQYDEYPGSDGHFVIFDLPSAQAQASGFLRSLAQTGTATLSAP